MQEKKEPGQGDIGKQWPQGDDKGKGDIGKKGGTGDVGREGDKTGLPPDIEKR